MESIEDIQNLWKQNKEQPAASIDQNGLEAMINSETKKQHRVIANYVALNFIWITIVLAALCHLIIRFWDDRLTVISCLAGIGVFMIFTNIFMKRFKAVLFTPTLASEGGSLIKQVQTKYDALRAYYNFKRAADWFITPVCCLAITLGINNYFLNGSVSQNPVFNLVTFGLSVVLFVAANRHNNTVYFKAPIDRLAQVIQDAETNNANV